MGKSLLGDAFAHHVWATLELVDACLSLSPAQLAINVTGTYGSILDTLRHLVDGDTFYLSILSSERTSKIDTSHMDLARLRGAMQRNGGEWSRLLQEDLDPDAVLTDVDDDDGYRRDAPMGTRLAQALHHGNDHRSQVCTALATLGVEPPGVSVWDFGLQNGRIVEVLPPS